MLGVVIFLDVSLQHPTSAMLFGGVLVIGARAAGIGLDMFTDVGCILMWRGAFEHIDELPI